ncbi:hypothetical protein EPUL_006619 [Erysiphe pulchra]|uniref:Uncharacterized protein n=1 Tax=Erysiphe pulchra TaxID=225359 RepID=A0A2S4PJ48_9PEZI|nr:hypothetical protein EPUL_006619 [Erysiphe pulchra]
MYSPTAEQLEKGLIEGININDNPDDNEESDNLSNVSNDNEKLSDDEDKATKNLGSLAITQGLNPEVTTTLSRTEQLETLSSDSYKLNFSNVIKELNGWDFKVIQMNSTKLAASLTQFVEVGSIIHKLTPDDLTIVANLKGKYDNKEETLVDKVDDAIIPRTAAGLMANGTKFLDAIIYLSMDISKRPKPTPTDMEPNEDDILDLSTYDDSVKLTTYMFVIFFYILIRARLPADNGDYNLPMPKFITTILDVHDPIGDIVDYIASFDIQKIDPAWVQNVPAKNISQKAINQFGLGVAGYRLVSVFNIVNPDLYAKEPVPTNMRHINDKPEYIDSAVEVARSFVTAGHCWDFHPATRNPNIITKYGNINKNAANLLLECYTVETLKELVKIKKLAVLPKFDPSHTNFRLWDKTMRYKATKPIFKN